jgi:hypothetical protein
VWIPLATGTGGGSASTYRQQQIPLYGQNGGVSYPINCDVNGNLVSGGAAGGDLSGNYPSPTVVKVDGAAVPVSKTLVGTNASGQIIDASTSAPALSAANMTGFPATIPLLASANNFTNANNFFKSIQVTMVGNSTGATITPGSAINGTGTGYVAPACAASHKCSGTHGTVTFTTGSTAATTGVLLTVTDANAHSNQPDCMAHIVLTASPYTELSGYLFSYSTTVWTLNVGTAPATSSAYTVTYHCFGY